jgi:hypothetical protein
MLPADYQLLLFTAVTSLTINISCKSTRTGYRPGFSGILRTAVRSLQHTILSQVHRPPWTSNELRKGNYVGLSIWIWLLRLLLNRLITTRMNLTPPIRRITFLTALVVVLGATTVLPINTRAATATEMDRSVRAGLRRLYASTPSARMVGQRTRAVLGSRIVSL